jgi:puromycin-sensitive aminopeptidase
MSDSARLDRTVVPIRYDLIVDTDADISGFTGHVTIALEVVEPTSTVTLHAKDLTVEFVALDQDGHLVGAELSADPEAERITIRTESPLAAGPATLRLRFAGVVSRGLLGYYRSTFVDESGAERVLAATQFEAPHARRAFPCFDEPEFKAVFGVTLVVAGGLLAISNGPEIERETLDDGRIRVAFGDTIPMSTYLVAWVVGPLELTAPVDVGGVSLRVAHVPGKSHLTRFALDVGAFAIRFFVDYYGIPYPGEKCDLVALPDFSFGAMENLGCVTFRESRLLLDPDQVTLSEASDAALTIVHEIAHMWFGDLVTMKWWNGIWLNEAFATFMEHLGVDAYRAEWQTWDDFALGRAAALDVDALSNTRTVEYEVITPSDADGMFDLLTYQKGGSVLRMVERWLGADSFRDGVRHYLDRYQLANTETTDLWDSLESATSEPVRRIMDSWIFQPGFPLIAAAAGDGSVTISQQRFGYEASDATQRWAIPVRARVHAGASSDTRSLLLDGDSVTFDVPADALVVLDAGGEGFYRVSYPREWRDRLLDSGALESLERFSLVDDLWAAVLADRAPAGDVLALARKLRDEQDLVVWRVLVSVLRGTARLVEGEALARLRAEVGDVLAPTFSRLGWEPGAGDDARTRQLRGVVLDALGTLVEDPSVIDRARETNTDSGTDPDVASACVAITASAGDRETFDEFVRRAADAPTPQAQLRYLYAIGSFPTDDLALRAARHAMSDAVRPQNGPFVLQRLLRNREHGPLVWTFVRDHWSEVRARFSGSLIPRLLEGVTWLVDDASIVDVPRFLADHPVPEGTRVIAQHLERQRVHRALVDRERARLTAALLGGGA